HEGLGGSVQNGHFDGIDVDKNVVDSAGINRRQQVFSRGKQHALFHQACGVTHPGDVFAPSLNDKVVEIGPADYYARACGRGNQPQMSKNSGVKAYAFRTYFALDGRLKHSLYFSKLTATVNTSCALFSVS